MNKRGIKKDKKQAKIDPKVKDVLILLGAGTFIAASLLMPGLPLALKPFINIKRQKEQNEWKKFSSWRLKQILKRMYDQKLVEIAETKDSQVVKISDKGRKKLLKYNIDEMIIDNKKWDGKWRIIVYDILTGKKQERELFRKTLKRMKFWQLQKSVYLTPFECKDEIEYLRQVCDIGEEVLILTVSGLENENAYKEYFGLT